MININSWSDTQPLIFIDHVAYGSPLEPEKPDSYCVGHYAPNIDKVGQSKPNFILQVKT